MFLPASRHVSDTLLNISVSFSSGVCIAMSLQIPREPTDETFHKILTDLASQPKARAVVMFVNEDNVQRLLEATRRHGMTGNFYWLASDSWGAKTYPIKNQEWAAEGAVTILPQRKVIHG